MAARYQHLRRVNGAAGSPAVGDGVEGMIALNMPGTAGTGTNVELWAHDGAAWRLLRSGVPSSNTAPTGPANGDMWVDTSLSPPILRVYNGTNWVPVGSMPIASTTAPTNPIQGQLWADTTGGAGNLLLKGWNGTAWVTINAAVTTQAINLTPQNASADIGAAYVAAGNPAITGNIVIATWGSPAQAYLLTTPGSPGLAGSWTSLGGSTPFASDAEVLAGTVQTSAISPKGLQSRIIQVPTGPGGTAAAADENKLIALDATGHIDSRFLNLNLITFRGGADLTAAPAVAWASGDFGIVTAIPAAGVAPNAGWTGVATNQAHVGDLIIYDGTRYDIVSATAGAQNAVLRAGANAIADDQTMTWAVPAAAGLVTRLDGTDPAKSSIDNFTLDAGVY